MRILKRVPDSSLWLFEDNEICANNLRLEAQNRGVAGHRLVFARRAPLDDHLARHCLADLSLDTLPCSAHTTASDALWAGLPMLTQVGSTFAGRVASSVLSAMDLPELITRTAEEFENVAVALAENPAKLKELKQKVHANRFVAPLFDAKKYAHHLGHIFRTMRERHVAGLAPVSFTVV